MGPVVELFLGHPKRQRPTAWELEEAQADIGVGRDEFPCRKAHGEEPSKQPPDWWNIKGPYCPQSFCSSSTAAPDNATREEYSPGMVMAASSTSSAAVTELLLVEKGGAVAEPVQTWVWIGSAARGDAECLVSVSTW